MNVCKNCRYAVNPYKDPFTGKIECFCGISEPIIGEFGDQCFITSNMVTSCEGFEPRATKYIEDCKSHKDNPQSIGCCDFGLLDENGLVEDMRGEEK